MFEPKWINEQNTFWKITQNWPEDILDIYSFLSNRQNM